MLRKIARLPGLILRLALENFFCLGQSKNLDGNKILLVKLDAIGDFIVWLGFAAKLVDSFRCASTVLVCNELVADIAFQSGLFSDVVPVNVATFRSFSKYRFHLLRKVRFLGCGVAIQPTYSRSFLLGESIIRCSGARKRIGSIGDTSNMSRLEKSLADGWYTWLLPASSAGLSELERHKEFLSYLGVTAPHIELADLSQYPWPQSLAQPSGSFIVLFPGASAALRRWPPECFAELAAALKRSHGFQIVVCGSSADAPLADAIAVALPELEVINFCGSTSLLELIGVINAAQLLVSNETSASHIAVATGTPSVCLLGGGHFGRFMPYPTAVPFPRPVAVYSTMPCFHCNWQCIHPLEPSASAPCLEAITVEMALQAAHQALAHGSSPETAQ